MNQPEKYIARLVVLDTQIVSRSIKQGVSSGLVSLYQLASSFVDHQKVIVFVEDVHNLVHFDLSQQVIVNGQYFCKEQ